jgi:hypothetical protein
MAFDKSQRFCLVKILQAEESKKAAKYFAALIGSGIEPEDVPDSILAVFRRFELKATKEAVSWPPHSRCYGTADMWAAVQKADIGWLGLAAEVMLKAAIEDKHQ